jgi:hypothetical protein
MAAYGTPPRDPHQIASPSEKNKQYTILYALLDDCRAMRRAENAALKSRTEEARGTKVELKKARSEVVTLTKKEHAKSKEKSAAAYATTAATTLIISYQIVEVSGGWGKWEPVFTHEATIGVLQVLIGSILAFAMRPLQ